MDACRISVTTGKQSPLWFANCKLKGMTVLLVIVTFVVFIAIDMLLRKRSHVLPLVTAGGSQPVSAWEELLSGFHVQTLFAITPVTPG